MTLQQINVSKTLFAALCIAVLLVPGIVAAETVVRGGEEITVGTDQRVDGDFYVAAQTAVMSGVVAGDMYAIGNTVTVNGPVEADIAALGRVVALHASSADDVRLVAAEVVIADAIAGDLFVLGGTVDLLPTASVGGNVYLFAADATINAPVGGSIYGAVERVRIDSEVAGNVDLRAPAGLTLGDGAAIGGNVTYTSRIPLVRSPQSEVAGEVAEKPLPETSTNEQLRSVLIPLFIVLFGVLSLYLLARPFVLQVAHAAVEKPLLNVLTGAAVLLFAPMVIVLMLATVIGSLLALGLFALQLLGIVLALLLAGTAFGWFVETTYFKRETVSLVTVFVGTAVLFAVLFIPFLGMILVTGFFLLVLGTLTRLLIGRFLG